jgi:hypothetical protein
MEKIATAKQTNRRKSQRRRLRGSVKVECRKGSYGMGPNLASTTLDLSDTGARLIVTQALDILGEVEILIGGYGLRKPIKRLAYIRWQVKLEDGQYCVGAEFQKRLAYRDWQNFASPS